MDKSAACTIVIRRLCLIHLMAVIVVTMSFRVVHAQQTLQLSPGVEARDVDFMKISDGLFLSGDGFAVSQCHQDQIWVFAGDGKRTAVLGRSGSGPGEFQTLALIGEHNDSIWGIDVTLQRVVVFSGSGRHLTTFRFAPPTAPGLSRPPTPLAVLADGSILAIQGRSIEQDPDMMRPFMRFSRDGRELGTFAGVRAGGTSVRVRLGEVSLTFNQPLRSGTFHDLSSDGTRLAVCQAGNAATDRMFSIEVFNAAGERLWQRGVPYTPVRVSRKDAELVLDQAMQVFDGSSLPQQLLNRAREEIVLPEFYPPVSDVIVTNQGQVWVRGPGLPASDIRWDIFDDRGAHIGWVAVPTGFDILDVDGRRVLVTYSDELGVPHLQVYRTVDW